MAENVFSVLSAKYFLLVMILLPALMSLLVFGMCYTTQWLQLRVVAYGFW